MKIKVHCVGIVDHGTKPMAVIVSDIKQGRGISPTRYVLLDNTLRAALSQMACDLGQSYSRHDGLRPEGLPALIASHAWDARGTVTDDVPLARRTERWTNGATAWVRTDVIAVAVLDDLRTWRRKNPPCAGFIWAPNWNALAAVQALALAAGLPVPTVDGWDPQLTGGAATYADAVLR